MKRITRLTESDLHRIVKEPVKRVLNEVSIDTLQRAQDKAFDEYDSIRLSNCVKSIMIIPVLLFVIIVMHKVRIYSVKRELF